MLTPRIAKVLRTALSAISAHSGFVPHSIVYSNI